LLLFLLFPDLEDGGEGVQALHLLLLLPRHADDLYLLLLRLLANSLGIYWTLALWVFEVIAQILWSVEGYLALEAPDDGLMWESRGREGRFAQAPARPLAARPQEGRVLEESFLLLETFVTPEALDVLGSSYPFVSSFVLLEGTGV